MKSLLRSSIVALLVFGGYAAFSSDFSKSQLSAPQLPMPCHVNSGNSSAC